MKLTGLQKKLIELVQQPLPVCRRPFDVIAEKLNTDPQSVIDNINTLKSKGLIRRCRPQIDYCLLGKAASLIAAHVEPNDLSIVAAVVNALPGVSHNYIREHYYNLWFTLHAEAEEEIDRLVANLSKRLEIDFHSLPAKTIFKLRLFFPEHPPGVLMRCDAPEPEDLSSCGTVELTDQERYVLQQLQGELEITSCPFDYIASDALTIEAVVETIQSLVDRGVVRRISAVADQNALGYTANAMLCAAVGAERILEAGRDLAAYSMVSHCYERPGFPGWPYELFAMVHAASEKHIQQLAGKFCSDNKIEDFAILPTAAELKKTPVIYSL